ncbi:chaplin [Nocardiopsis sp. RSe5-2]|uniref:Chaplin n=1 Tax=Nocardiopsis endophytica TaxID=3018445 RepID=A0ABT4TY13_9ACTN|nr:chaplin [Nocardiopsis endophytica]MDA2809573.1 chaplin [Nocardiopsis endophytica]
MRKRLTTTTTLALLTAGFAAAPLTAAWAGPVTDGSGGAASGNQISVPADVEADLCGNALSVLGISKAECTEVAKAVYSASDKGSGGPTTDGSGGVASGNQINIPVDAALDICGNSAAIGGVSKADCTKVVERLADESGGGSGGPTTDGSGGVASGNQINIPVDAAITVCGNSVAVLGTSKAECTTVVNVITTSPENEEAPQTDGSGGVGSGNQINIPVDAAVEICGNAVSVLGVAKAECMDKVGHGDHGGGSDGDDGSDGDGGGDDGKDHQNGGDDGADDGGDGPGDGGDEGDGGSDGGKDGGSGAPGKDGDGGSGDAPKKELASQVSSEEDLLPVTGGALVGLIAAAVAAVGGGGAAMAVARKKRRAAAHAAD